MTGRTEEIRHWDGERYVRRGDQDQVGALDDAGRLLSHDQRRDSQTDVEKGQGDKGDRQD